MKKITLVLALVFMLFSCHKSSSPTPNPADAIAGTYVGTYHYYYQYDSLTIDTAYQVTCYITAVDTDSVHINCPPLNMNQTSRFYYFENEKTYTLANTFDGSITQDTLSFFFTSSNHTTNNLPTINWYYTGIKKN